MHVSVVVSVVVVSSIGCGEGTETMPTSPSVSAATLIALANLPSLDAEHVGPLLGVRFGSSGHPWDLEASGSAFSRVEIRGRPEPVGVVAELAEGTEVDTNELIREFGPVTPNRNPAPSLGSPPEAFAQWQRRRSIRSERPGRTIAISLHEDESGRLLVRSFAVWLDGSGR